jgi:hypothetical protein
MGMYECVYLYVYVCVSVRICISVPVCISARVCIRVQVDRCMCVRVRCVYRQADGFVYTRAEVERYVDGWILTPLQNPTTSTAVCQIAKKTDPIPTASQQPLISNSRTPCEGTDCPGNGEENKDI